jgi:hypothetical protein
MSNPKKLLKQSDKDLNKTQTKTSIPAWKADENNCKVSKRHTVMWQKFTNSRVSCNIVKK